ncbi:hypothetical protein MF672_012920 [Actinomadura sp. ATCC 31491]|uniref:Uncharacterized protein n=1 Tax=Actinomadura luzonensis TaxID=2805427 RepID=A0ABT0FQR8_9ACTN|nr:hypothetical protein [Actinomadura luzonensis]MCK2214689.1 hypothetical protein [Actinomadura luzonensis]
MPSRRSARGDRGGARGGAVRTHRAVLLGRRRLARGGLDRRTGDAALRQLEAAGGVVTSVAGFAADLVRDFAPPAGRRVIAALHELV